MGKYLPTGFLHTEQFRVKSVEKGPFPRNFPQILPWEKHVCVVVNITTCLSENIHYYSVGKTYYFIKLKICFGHFLYTTKFGQWLPNVDGTMDKVWPLIGMLSRFK